MKNSQLLLAVGKVKSQSKVTSDHVVEEAMTSGLRVGGFGGITGFARAPGAATERICGGDLLSENARGVNWRASISRDVTDGANDVIVISACSAGASLCRGSDDVILLPVVIAMTSLSPGGGPGGDGGGWSDWF